MPHRNGVVKARQVLLLMAGTVISIIGMAAGVVVMLRYLYPLKGLPPQFDLRFFIYCCMILTAGLMLIYSGNPSHVFRLITSQMPGGQRSTDPPLETAPPPLPRHQWPDPPPRQPRAD